MIAGGAFVGGGEFFGELETSAFAFVAGEGFEFLHSGDFLGDESLLHDDFGIETGLIPIGGENSFSVEEVSDLWISDRFSFVSSIDHDVEEGFEGRAGEVDAAVLEVVACDLLLGLDDIVDAIDEVLLRLFFGTEHVAGEDGVGRGEHATEVGGYEVLVDAVSETAGVDGAAVFFKVIDLFEEAIFDEEFRIALVDIHAGPDFGNEQGDVVLEAILSPDVAGGAGIAGVVGEDITHQRRVEVMDGKEGIEWAFREGSLAASSGGRGDSCR